MRTTNFKWQRLARPIALLLMATLSHNAFAQGVYPSRPIAWVVPYASGAATDTLTRRLAQDVSIDLGQPIVVENQPGAGTVNAAMALTRAKADGYRVMTADSATLALNPALIEKLAYDPQKSFSMLGMFARFPLVLVVHKNVPAKSIPELIEYLKQRPGKINYASAGLGSPHHLAMELFQESTSVSMVHIPYGGAGPALVDLLAGRTELMFASLGSISSHLQLGNLRALAVSGSTRFASAPNIPTVAESDVRLKDYEMYAWQGVVAPAGLPDEVRAKFATSLRKVVATESIKSRFLELGVEAVVSTPEAFESYASNEANRWTTLVKKRGIKRE